MGGLVRLLVVYIGIIGYKFFYGMILCYGVIFYVNSLDIVGFFSK